MWPNLEKAGNQVGEQALKATKTIGTVYVERLWGEHSAAIIPAAMTNEHCKRRLKR